MRKLSRLPHEQVIAKADDGVDPEHARDGLRADQDVEGHGQPDAGERFLPGLPGTGGDRLRRPASGGEIDGNDVEGHVMGHTKGERLSPGMPGTGGDDFGPGSPGTGGDGIAVEVDPEGVSRP